MSDDSSQDEPAFVENNHGLTQEGDETRLVTCDYCDAELELSDEELAQGWYVCLECGELSHLGDLDIDAFDAPQAAEADYRDARPRPREEVECGHCGESVSLSTRQTKQRWFFCPFCHELGQLEDYITCLSCGSQLELSEEEKDQGWYRCPECAQVTRLVEEPEAESAEWVQLKTAAGPEEAALEAAFLRANGVEALTWQQGAGHAYGLTVGMLGASHIMVRQDQLELARSVIESQAEEGLEEDQPADSVSDTSKAVMGMAALALSPIGVGLALGASQLLGRHHADEQAYLVECGHCGETVNLSARQTKQGWFFCPHCHGLGQLDDFVTCLSCGSELELIEEEWDQGWYRCPECDQVTEMVESAEEEAGSKAGSPADSSAYLVECTQCGTPLELSDQEVAQGHFICPECRWLIQLSNYVVCPVCQTRVALDEAQRKQGWYRCPECDQVTQL